jgi:iron complex transport system substrate-binding protein
VAVTTADDYPPEVASLPKIGAYPLNREAVVGQDPDLVLATDQVNSTHEVAPISDLGIPTYFLQFESFDEIIGAVRTVGRLLNTTEFADSSADALAARWKHLEAASRDTERKPRVLLLVGSDVLYAFGSDSYTNEMIIAAGGDPITDALPGQSAVLNDEFVLANAPDIILGPQGTETGPGFSRATLLANHPSWDAVPAIRFGDVHTLDPDLIFRPGPRVVDAAERIAEIITHYLGGRNP